MLQNMNYVLHTSTYEFICNIVVFCTIFMSSIFVSILIFLFVNKPVND